MAREGEYVPHAAPVTWRYTASAGVQQLHFRADGRFERDLGSRATVGVTERTSATATGGRFTLRDGELVLAPEHRPQRPDRYRVRLYDEWVAGGWKRAIRPPGRDREPAARRSLLSNRRRPPVTRHPRGNPAGLAG